MSLYNTVSILQAHSGIILCYCKHYRCMHGVHDSKKVTVIHEMPYLISYNKQYMYNGLYTTAYINVCLHVAMPKQS